MVAVRLTALDEDFISTIDCFHPSLMAHQSIAVATWNSLITPREDKKLTFNVDDEMLCAGVDTLLETG